VGAGLTPVSFVGATQMRLIIGVAIAIIIVIIVVSIVKTTKH